MKKIFFCAAALAHMAVACDSVEEGTPVQYGELNVALGEPDVEVFTKAETVDPSYEVIDNFTVRLYNSSDEKLHEAAYSGFGTQKLPLGTYYVTAENCSASEAETANDGKGRMHLYGRSSDIVLSADNISRTADVTCEVANARLTVVFDSSVSGRFSDLQVVLTGSGAEPVRTVTVAETGSEVVTWFNPQTVSYAISGKFIQLDNKPVSINGTYSLEAKDNIKLVVKLNLDNGQLLPEIAIDTTIEDPTEVPEEFNPYE